MNRAISKRETAAELAWFSPNVFLEPIAKPTDVESGVREILYGLSDRVGGPIAQAKDDTDLAVRIEEALCGKEFREGSAAIHRYIGEHFDALVTLSGNGRLDPRWRHSVVGQASPDALFSLADGDAVTSAIAGAADQVLAAADAWQAPMKDVMRMVAEFESVDPRHVLVDPTIPSAVSAILVAERRARVALLALGYLVRKNILPPSWMAKHLAETWLAGIRRYLGFLASALGVVVPRALLKKEDNLNVAAAEKEVSSLRAADIALAHGR